ncbi:MAG: hypothetical protein ACXWRE_13390, partial [Pseudobdellovibrionaceae bacterium]
LQHLVVVSLRAHLRQHRGDLPLGVDHERRTLVAPVLASVHRMTQGGVQVGRRGGSEPGPAARNHRSSRIERGPEAARLGAREPAPALARVGQGFFHLKSKLHSHDRAYKKSCQSCRYKALSSYMPDLF